MANRYGDPRVREWMKNLKNRAEVDAVQAKYDELKSLSTEELLEIAPDEVIAKVKAQLIVGIIKKGA